MSARRAYAQSGTLTTQDPNGEVRLSTNPEQSESEIWTVQFAITPPSFPAAAVYKGWIRPIATVSWMIAGNPIVRQLEVGDGVTISGACEAVTVRVVDQTTQAPAGVQYGVTIAATPGCARTSANPPFLQAGSLATSIPASTTTMFARPQSAGVNSVRIILGGGGITTNAPNVNIAGGHAPLTAPAFARDMVGYTANDSGWIPWPPEAGTTLAITNLDNANAIYATVYWGIDG